MMVRKALTTKPSMLMTVVTHNNVAQSVFSKVMDLFFHQNFIHSRSPLSHQNALSLRYILSGHSEYSGSRQNANAGTSSRGT